MVRPNVLPIDEIRKFIFHHFLGARSCSFDFFDLISSSFSLFRSFSSSSSFACVFVLGKKCIANKHTKHRKFSWKNGFRMMESSMENEKKKTHQWIFYWQHTHIRPLACSHRNGRWREKAEGGWCAHTEPKKKSRGGEKNVCKSIIQAQFMCYSMLHSSNSLKRRIWN